MRRRLEIVNRFPLSGENRNSELWSEIACPVTRTERRAKLDRSGNQDEGSQAVGGGKKSESLDAATARLMAAIDVLEAEIRALRQERAAMAHRIAALETEISALRQLKGSVATRLDDSIRRVEGLLARTG